MERRSFLASLAALFVARKLPSAPPVRWYGVLTDRWYWTRDGEVVLGEYPRPPVEFIRFDEAEYSPTFTRASTAPYVTGDGTVAIAGMNVPRTKILPGIHTLEEMRALDNG